MPMNEEVRKALDRVQIICDTESEWADIPIADWRTLNNELTRLTEIADAVDPLVVQLGEVTRKLERANTEIERLESAWHVETLNKKDRLIALQEVENDRVKSRLEATNALLRSCNAACNRVIEQDGGILGGIDFNALGASITAHLSEPRT